MNLLPTRAHGVIDYVVGLLLLAAPYLFGFADGSAAQYVPMALGAATIVYSLLTRYELGLVPAIPMPVHLGLDVLNGGLLAASPWLFGFADRVYLPHVVVGLMELGVVLISRSRPEPTLRPI